MMAQDPSRAYGGGATETGIVEKDDTFLRKYMRFPSEGTLVALRLTTHTS